MAEKFSLTAQLNLQAPKNVKQVFSQIQKQLSGATVNVNVAKSAQAVKDLNKVAVATKKIETESKKAAKGADVMGKAFGSALKNVLRYDLARRVFSAFTNTVEQGIKDAIDFERAMIRIAQVSGRTMQQLKGLEATITRLSTTLGVSSSSLVKVGLILKQTGLSVRDTELAMAALAKTELAPTFDNITDTAETAVAAMRQFGLEASRLEGLLGKINTVAANFAVESSDIGVAIKRAGGAFKSAGGQVEELIALFTSVRATTRETAETIATGFRTIFTRLQRPTTIKFLRQFGIELTDLNGKFVGPYEAVNRLNNALQNLDPRDLRYSQIVEQLGGFRQVSKVIPLIQQFNTAQAAYKAQMEGSDSLAQDAATAQQSLAVQLQKLTENVKELFREITQSSAFQALAKMAIGLANAITKIGKALAPVLPILGAFVAARAAAWAGGKLFGGGVGGLNNALGSAMGDTSDVYKGNRGGRVPKRFSRGGWVPGTGNGDTVPALLEPGEFVIRKSAAQAFGPKLSGINKYGRGGATMHSVGYAGTHDGDSYHASITPTGQPYTTTTRLMGADAVEKPGTGAKGKAARDAWAKKYGDMPHPGDLATSIAKSHMRGRGGAAFNNMFFDPSKVDDQGNKKQYGYDSTGRRPLFNAPGLVEKLLNTYSADGKPLAKKMAKGGLVPSLLTPGEFVVNKKSAQSMGYGKLRSMNRYANGGVVSGGGGNSNVPISQVTGAGIALDQLRESAVSGAGGLYQMGEAATIGYAKTAGMVTGIGAVAEQLGMGGKALDFWTETLATSGGILSGFNSMMDQAQSSGFMDQLSGFADMLGDKNSKVGGILDSFGGKLSQKGGILGKVGKGIQGGGGLMQKGLKNVQDFREKGFMYKSVNKQEAKLAQVDRIKAQPAKFKAKALEQAKRAEAFKGTASNLGQRAGQEFGKAKSLRAQQQALVTKRTTPMGKAGRAEYHKLGKMADEAEKAGKALKAQGQAASDAAKKFAKSSATNMSNSAKATKTVKAMAPQLTKAAKGAKFAAMGLKALNPVAIIAEVAIGKLGNAIEQDALKTIQSGEFEAEDETGLKAKAAGGSALKGAATGAAIGMILGPFGAAAGAAVGALWGAVKGWMNAAKEIEKAKFGKALKSLEGSMKGLEEGTSSTMEVFTEMKNMKSAIKDFGDSVGSVKTDEANNKIREAGNAILDHAKNNATSVEDFRARIKDTVDLMNEDGSTRKDQIAALERELAARLKSEAAIKAAAEAQRKLTRTLADLRNLSGIFNEVSYRVKHFGEIIQGISDPLSGGAIASITDRMRPEQGDKRSIERFESTIDGLSNIAGEAGGKTQGLGRVAGRAKEAGFLNRNLVQAITLASESGGIEEEGGAAKAIIDQLTNAATGEGGKFDTTTGLGKRIQDQLMKEMDEADLKEAMKDPAALAEKLSGAADEYIEVFKSAGEMTDKHLQQLQAAYAQKVAMEQSYISKMNSIADQEFAMEERSRARLGKDPATNAEVQAQFGSKVGRMTAGVGGIGGLKTGVAKTTLSAGGGVGDVGAVGAAFSETSAALAESNAEMASLGLSFSDLADKGKSLSDSQKELIQKNSDLKSDYGTLQGVLNEYANSQQRLTALNKEAADASKRTGTLKDLAIQSQYGTAEEKDSANRLINAVAIAQTEGLDAVAPELQKQVIGILENMGEGDIVNKDLEAKGFGGAGITTASAEQERIDSEIKDVEKQGIDAQKALAAEEKSRIEEMSKTIEDLHKTFIKELKSLFIAADSRRVKAELAAADVAVDKQTGQMEKLVKIAEAQTGKKGQEAYDQFFGSKSGGKGQARLDVITSGKLREDRAKVVQASKMKTLLGGDVKRTKGMSSGDALDTGDANIKQSLIAKKLLGDELSTFQNLRNVSTLDFEATLDQSGGEAGGVDDYRQSMADIEANMKKNYEALGLGGKYDEKTGKMTADGEGFEKIKAAAKKELMDEKEIKADEFDSTVTATELYGRILSKIESEAITAQEMGTRKAKSAGGLGFKVMSGGGATSTTVAKSLQGVKVGGGENDIANTLAASQADQAAAKASLDTLATEATNGNSLDTHDHTAESLLKAILDTLQGKKVKGAAEKTGETMKKSLSDIAKQVHGQKVETAPITKMDEKIKAAIDKMGVYVGGTTALNEDMAQTISGGGPFMGGFSGGGDAAQMIAAAAAAINPQELRPDSSGEGTVDWSADTEGLNDSISRFSKATEELGGVMGNALSVEVGGTIDVNVNMNGAEFLKGAQDSLGKYASQQVSKGINNFITQGLKNNNVKTRPDWVNEGGTNGIPGSSNNESGSM